MGNLLDEVFDARKAMENDASPIAAIHSRKPDLDAHEERYLAAEDALKPHVEALIKNYQEGLLNPSELICMLLSL